MNINDECRDMAIKLFLYCNYKGLGFSPNGFSHLAPVAVKENTGNYIETLEDMYFEKADVTTFIGQYFRNHLDDRTLVPDITGASYVSEVNLETENFDVKVDFNSSMDDKKLLNHLMIKVLLNIYLMFILIIRGLIYTLKE